MKVELRALDGRSPIAFMAALGTLRLLGGGTRLGWVRRDGAWKPVIWVHGQSGGEAWVGRTVHTRLQSAPLGGVSAKWLTWDGGEPPKDIVLRSDRGAVENERLYRLARRSMDPETERFVAAYGTWKAGKRPEFLATGFSMRASRQYLLSMVREGTGQVTEGHVKRALFGGWTYADPKASYGWYPGRPASHATSTTMPTDLKPTGELGALLLAFHGMPFFPVLPSGNGAQTAGFRRAGREWEFVWPLWRPLLGEPEVRVLLLECASLGLEELKRRRRELEARGVRELRRSRRVVEQKSQQSSRAYFADSDGLWSAA